MNRWDNLAELQRNHDGALRLIRQQGVIFADDSVAKGQAREILAKIFLAMPDVFFDSCLSLVFVYDMDAQPPPISGDDGYASVSERQSNGQQVASIRISLQALHAVEDHAVLSFCTSWHTSR